MKALVTGASGFIGSQLIEELNTLGFEVHALMRKTSSPANLKGQRYERREGDLTDPASVAKAVEGMDYIFHLAGVVAARSEEEYFKHNQGGVANLAQAAAEHCPGLKRFVLVSSLAAGGPADTLTGLKPVRSESDSDAPVSAYGRSKLAGEQELLKYKDRFSCVIVRPPMVYGPKDKGVYVVIQTVARGIVPLMPTQTEAREKYYSAIHVKDLCRGIAQAALAPAEKIRSGEVFYFNDGEQYSFPVFIKTIAEQLGVRTFKFKLPRFGVWCAAQAAGLASKITGKAYPLNPDKLNEILVDHWTCSSDKAVKLLSYHPEYKLQKGMADTVSWYRKNGWLASVALLLALGAASGLSACNQEIDHLGVKLKIDQRVLNNGLKVIMVEDHTVPVVSYQSWFRVGSVDESPGITGISHLFEHLMFKGTPKYGPKRFFHELESKGAEVNAFTSRDYTCYYVTAGSALLPKIIDMESDRLQNISFTSEDLASEKAVVFEERKLRTDNSPEGKIQEALWLMAYQQHSYRWPVIGYPQDLAALSLEKVREYFGKHYQPGNLTVVIVGDFKSEEVFAQLKKSYGPISSRPRPVRDYAKEPEQKEERRLQLHDAVASDRFSHAYHVTSAEESDSFALDVLANVLFEGTSSRAFHRLVEDKDIAHVVQGSAYTPTFPGLFIINGIMKGDNSAEAAEAELEAVIREVQEKGVSPEEVRMAVRQLTVQLVDSIRTPQGLGQLIGTVDMTFSDPTRFARDLSKYFKVTPADVQRVARKYLVPNNRSIVILRKKEGA